jgi:hypothetical protein
VRSPAYRAHLLHLIDGNVAPLRRAFPHWAQGLPDALHERLSSTENLVDQAIRMIPRVASIVASMHATLLEANRPAVMTSDHPIAPVPFSFDRATPVQAIPNTGLLNISEMRMPLNPSFVLLLSWYDDFDTPSAVPIGEIELADCNRAMIGQFEHQLFFHPDWFPPYVVPPWQYGPVEPLAPKIIDGYDETAARASERREKAGAQLDAMARDGIYDRMATVKVASRVRNAA